MGRRTFPSASRPRLLAQFDAARPPLHRYVAVTQLGGQGNFTDPRLGIDIKHAPDMVTAKLPALRAYQHSLPAPPPPAGSVDAASAARGRTVFDRTCAS